MITVKIGKLQKCGGQKVYKTGMVKTYTHSADVRMWVGNNHHSIGALKQRYFDDKLDFVPSGTLMEDEMELAMGFKTIEAAQNWIQMRLNSRELIATALA